MLTLWQLIFLVVTIVFAGLTFWGKLNRNYLRTLRIIYLVFVTLFIDKVL